MRYIFLSVLLLLILRVFFFYFYPLVLSSNQHVSFSATLFDDPKVMGNTQEFSLSFGSFWQQTNVLIKTDSDTVFSYGQEIEVNGTLKKELLNKKDVVWTIQNPKIEARNGQFLTLFGSIRQKIMNFCENNFSQPYSGLLVGIIFGIKSLLTDQITRSFRITGLSHIVAASGMNVTLVAGFLITLLSGLLKRQWAIALSIAGIFAYVAISGFEGSIVRAALMGVIAFSASLFGRQYSGLYILFLVGAGMLLFNPLFLVDVGFQLSILATAGILVLTPIKSELSPLAKQGSLVQKEPSLLRSILFSDDLRTTFAAQVATLPVILATFGTYSLFSLLTNLLVLWTIPPIMIVGGMGIVIGLFFEPLGKTIVWLTIPLLWYLQSVTSFFSNHNFSVQIENVPILFVVGYYLLLVGLVWMVKNKIKS